MSAEVVSGPEQDCSPGFLESLGESSGGQDGHLANALQKDLGESVENSVASEESHGPEPCLPTSDFPPPRAIANPELFLWDNDALQVDNYANLGSRLNHGGDLYRNPAYAGGLLLASPSANIQPKEVVKAPQLAALITDRLLVHVIKNGKPAGILIPSAHLQTMLNTEIFLRKFPALNAVVNVPQYLGDFRLTAPGYNDGGPGERVFYVGPVPEVSTSMDTINRFLDVMAFESKADRTNAVAAALTVMLRNHWLGGKPLLLVTSTKSHGGKETIIEFACGRTPHASISYEHEDWAVQKNFSAMIKFNPDLGVVNIENVRLDGGQTFVRSAFLERLLTDPRPVFFTTGTGDPTPRKNDIIVAMSTNNARISEDLLNRALRIALNPVGDVAKRTSPIGNPRLEYLPANRDKIEAELRGMIDRWKAAGRPLDTTAKHAFTAWAQTVGGILQVNGFEDFLASDTQRRTEDDPVREALGLLGIARPNTWLRPKEWVPVVCDLGLAKRLISEADRDSFDGRCRGVGVLFKAHRDETYQVETEDEVVTVQLKKARRRFDGGGPVTKYRFEVLTTEAIPADGE
jgi:hypothetical protein